MKRIITLLVLFALYFVSSAQSQVKDISAENNETSPVFVKTDDASPDCGIEFFSVSGTRATKSEWYNYATALSSLLSSKSNIYTLLFPDTIVAIYENSSNPGTYNTGRVRNHSVGSVFTPSSEILKYFGLDTLNRKQPYTLDSFAIEYNYMRFGDDNIVDTLIINIFKPQKLLYYSDNKIPKGASVRYDILENKGRDYTEQIVYLLTAKDTITYNNNGRGVLYFGLNNFNVTASSYGNPVAITWTYKPGATYTIEDSLNGSFVQTVPHSKMNHFMFWNLNDNDDYENNEFNNGIFIYSWTNEKKYLENTTYGPLYWRGSSFMNKNCYPICRFYITYDPSWVSISEKSLDQNISEVYPNPANDIISLNIENPEKHEMTYEILNVLGKTISNGVFNLNEGNNQMKIQINDLKSGLYFISLHSDHNFVKRTFLKN